MIEHDPALLRDPALLQSITSLVGIAIANTHLQQEVAERIADVESSRRRLLTVADAERDRLEADLQGESKHGWSGSRLSLRQSAHGDDWCLVGRYPRGDPRIRSRCPSASSG